MNYTRIDLGYTPNGEDAFTTAFCRTQRMGNVLVVGALPDCEREIAKMGPALISYQMWFRGRTRGYVRLENVPGFYVIGRHNRGKRQKYTLYAKRNGKTEAICEWRRVPSTFPRILEIFAASNERE